MILGDSTIPFTAKAGIAQLVERNLAKVEVASSSLVSRSIVILASLLYEVFYFKCMGLAGLESIDG